MPSRFPPPASDFSPASLMPLVSSVRSTGYGAFPVTNVSSAFDISAAE